jgi:hypothetical protein
VADFIIVGEGDGRPEPYIFPIFFTFVIVVDPMNSTILQNLKKVVVDIV